MLTYLIHIGKETILGVPHPCAAWGEYIRFPGGGLTTMRGAKMVGQYERNQIHDLCMYTCVANHTNLYEISDIALLVESVR